jgi:hypothetical protein
MPNQPHDPETPSSGTKVKAFLTGMIVAGSALVGGLAVVLWNRKAFPVCVILDPAKSPLYLQTTKKDKSCRAVSAGPYGPMNRR